MENRIYILKYEDANDYSVKNGMITDLSNEHRYNGYFTVIINNQRDFKMLITVSPNGLANLNPEILDDFEFHLNQLFS